MTVDIVEGLVRVNDGCSANIPSNYIIDGGNFGRVGRRSGEASLEEETGQAQEKDDVLQVKHPEWR